MEEADLDFANPEEFSDSFFNEIFKDSSQHHSCTHTHTCNPPGPDLSHTHTCFHVHTKILSASGDETAESTEKSSSSKKRPFGNREAVRKYRQKKKAQTASLEDEVVQLRAINQQLMKRVQGQAALEAEVARLKCLLVDIRGRIEGEIGSFPYQKPVKRGGELASDVTQGNLLGGGQVINACDFICDDQVYCVGPGMQGKTVGQNGAVNGQALGVCDIASIQCIGSSNSGSKNSLACGCGSMMPVGCSSDVEKY
ncbi:basic leucine zipper 19-like [Typha angustifolia]|uniref:basic leucine zipper 19-like n=1 Tax=Typha angustifolia TaxID=59011 RepID=UPI003C2E56C4